MKLLNELNYIPGGEFCSICTPTSMKLWDDDSVLCLRRQNKDHANRPCRMPKPKGPFLSKATSKVVIIHQFVLFSPFHKSMNLIYHTFKIII